MMGGVSPETCCASYKYEIKKCLIDYCILLDFFCELYYDVRIHEHQIIPKVAEYYAWRESQFKNPRKRQNTINPLKPELNPICYLLALLGAHHFLHVSRIRVKLLTFRLLMS